MYDDRIRACDRLQRPAPPPLMHVVLLCAALGVGAAATAHVALITLGEAAAARASVQAGMAAQ